MFCRIGNRISSYKCLIIYQIMNYLRQPILQKHTTGGSFFIFYLLLITSAISSAISSIVYVAVFLATLSAREGL